jgi:hypothetical protein
MDTPRHDVPGGGGGTSSAVPIPPGSVHLDFSQTADDAFTLPWRGRVGSHERSEM